MQPYKQGREKQEKEREKEKEKKREIEKEEGGKRKETGNKKIDLLSSFI